MYSPRAPAVSGEPTLRLPICGDLRNAFALPRQRGRLIGRKKLWRKGSARVRRGIPFLRVIWGARQGEPASRQDSATTARISGHGPSLVSTCPRLPPRRRSIGGHPRNYLRPPRKMKIRSHGTRPWPEDAIFWYRETRVLGNVAPKGENPGTGLLPAPWRAPGRKPSSALRGVRNSKPGPPISEKKPLPPPESTGAKYEMQGDNSGEKNFL